MRRFVLGALFVVVAVGLAITAVLAQALGERSSFVGLIEDLISTPDQKVSMSGLENVFSANLKLEQLTVSDREGPWLQLDGVDVTWERAALLDRLLHIESLSARRVTLLRRPVPSEETESEDSTAAMPLAVTIDSISLPLVTLAEPVAGVAAELAATGSARLTEEALAAELSVFRQDRAGELTADLRLEPGANVLTADLTLEEPAGGLIAELLQLPNRPAISAEVSGSGPLDSWDATMRAAAGGETILSGSLAVNRLEGSYQLIADMDAALESVVPGDYAALVAGESRLRLDVSRRDDGAIAIEEATLRSDGIDLKGAGVLAPDLVPESALVSLRLGQAGRTALPFAPGDVSLATLSVDAEVEPGAPSPWRLSVVAEGLESAQGGFARMAVSAGGEAENLMEPDARSVGFLLNATLEDVAPEDAALQSALGRDVRLVAEGSWSAGRLVDVSDLQLVLNDAAASFAGTATADEVEGDFGVTVSDLSRFAALADRALSGSAQLEAKGRAGIDGRFDLQLVGSTVDLALGAEPLDRFLAGATELRGGVARGDGAFTFDALTLTNERLNTEINGTFAGSDLDLALIADVADLSLVTERAAGKARISANLTGTAEAPRVEAEASGDEVLLMGRSLAGASARFVGVVAGPNVAGDAEIVGTFAEAPVRGIARLSSGEGGQRRLEGLDFVVGESRLEGDLDIGAGGLLDGTVTIVSPDLSKVAPLFLVEASGTLNAAISLTADGGRQSAQISATATDILYEGSRVGAASIEGLARDLYNGRQIEGDFSLREVVAGGLTILSATGTAEQRGAATEVTAEAELADGQVSFDAGLTPRDDGMGIALQRFSFSRAGLDLALASPTTIVVSEQTATLENTTLNAGGGSAMISGRAGQDDLDLTINLSALPASLVNGFAPEIGAQGIISGLIRVRGTAASPAAQFDIAVSEASVAASRNAGLGALNVSSRGAFADEQITLTSRIGNVDGLGIDVSGTVGIASGAPLDLKITGAVPLALGNPQLAARGAALSGVLNVDMAVTGTPTAPQYAGRVTAEGGGLVDPQSGIALSDLTLVASVSNNRLVIDQLSARSGEGTISADGSLGLDPAAGLPVDMRLVVRQARYVDGTLIAATFDADLAIGGRLSESPSVSGSVTLGRTEITVPERLPGDSVAVSVEHVAPSPAVERTLTIVRQRDGEAEDSGTGASGITLDIAVSAPARIFVRGRGLDAELGGELRLVGPLSAFAASGSFEIVRGRLDILTQRITLDRGIITFAGDLDPILDFIGTTQSGTTTINVAITGRASDPEISFTSSPALPQDEILAQLIFGKGLGELSPLQVARLGVAAGELAGGSGGGVLSQLRETTGLDDLDVVVDEEGEASVAAGSYISENVYIGVQQGSTAESSRVTIDLDITKGLKARAGYSAEGESSLGVFFEREY